MKTTRINWVRTAVVGPWTGWNKSLLQLLPPHKITVLTLKVEVAALQLTPTTNSLLTVEKARLWNPHPPRSLLKNQVSTASTCRFHLAYRILCSRQLILAPTITPSLHSLEWDVYFCFCPSHLCHLSLSLQLSSTYSSAWGLCSCRWLWLSTMDPSPIYK